MWDTCRDQVLVWDKIDKLAQDWETSTVDFKRELRLKDNDQKAEFIKDVVGLANTQASGDRWLVVGFDGRTRSYYLPDDPAARREHVDSLQSLKPETLHQILSQYTEPPVLVRLHRVSYRHGPVLLIEIQRDSRSVPYAVKKGCRGQRKQVAVGDVFVRHGSITEPPPEAERKALDDEAERSKRAPN